MQGKPKRIAPTDLAGQIVKFRERLAANDRRLAEINQQRGERALDAASGNNEAAAAIAALDRDGSALRAERDTLIKAISQAERLEQAQQQARIEADWRKREAQANRIAKTIMATNREIDATLLVLRNLFEDRASQLRRLASTRVLPDTLVLRLSQKHGPMCAAYAAGLRTHLDFAHMPPSQVQTLAAHDKLLSGFNAKASETKPASDAQGHRHET